MMASDKVNILLVDDQPAKLLSYEVILGELGENLVTVSSGLEALEYLLKNEIAVVLTDVCMPDLDGYQLAAMIREHPRFQKTAIILISAIHITDADRLRGYELGAVDYVLFRLFQKCCEPRYGSLWSSIGRLGSLSNSAMILKSASRSERRSSKRRMPA
jgi:CheY-like chemotaxis protein